TCRGGRSISPGVPEPLRELPPALRDTQDPDGSQRQAAARLLAVGDTVRDVPGLTSAREIPATRGHAEGTGSLRSNSIRYRSRSGNAERQTQTLSKRPEELRIIRRHMRLPLVGDQTRALTKQKAKPSQEGKTQHQVEGAVRLPLVGPERSKHHPKGEPTPA